MSVFDQVKTNTGSAYIDTTGIFSASKNNVYGFHLSVIVVVLNVLYFHIVKNGENFDTMVIYGNGHFTTEGEFWNIELMKGDEVWIRTETNYIEGHLGII
ncbi:hypothetical protein DPMN_175488 [Dreissena polymorpha]|uniref:C1q domain-containing protein n=1 Tax=Dreissena polymorpha TaxID=45954 RepID=A0A9D4E6J4_DREPO|nr:hypothetical protein DPMN_175462 [Dreissena polymorpha]KAH3774115.1 hypothetical protein DPMN_175488 [Dreissena polymorpha]